MLSKEEKFKNNSLRVKNRAVLNEILAPIFIGKTREEWIRAFREADILCSPINTFADILDDSALMESISLWKFKQMGKEIRTMGNPIEIHGEFLSMELPPPLKGEHTIAILEELGYNQAEVQAMVSQGIIYNTPVIYTQRHK